MKDLTDYIIEKIMNNNIVYRSDNNEPLQYIALITDSEEWDKFISEHFKQRKLIFLLADENLIADVDTRFELLQHEDGNILVNIDDERDMYDPHEYSEDNPYSGKYIVATTINMLEEK